MNRNHAIILTFSFLAFGSSLFAQSLSFGIKGGVPLTDAFSDNTITTNTFTNRTFSDSKHYVVGPMVELHLPFGLSVEADALYRPLDLTSDLRLATQSTATRSSTDIRSWEFPVLGKYRFAFPVIKPYIEAGPSFRAVGSGGSQLSNAGFTAGAGVELKLTRFRIGPELRYTRWGSDSIGTAQSKVNQMEFLVGFSF